VASQTGGRSAATARITEFSAATTLIRRTTASASADHAHPDAGYNTGK